MDLENGKMDPRGESHCTSKSPSSPCWWISMLSIHLTLPMRASFLNWTLVRRKDWD